MVGTVAVDCFADLVSIVEGRSHCYFCDVFARGQLVLGSPSLFAGAQQMLLDFGHRLRINFEVAEGFAEKSSDFSFHLSQFLRPIIRLSSKSRCKFELKGIETGLNEI